MIVECTYGPVSTEVMGTTYTFTADEHGRYVAEVWNPKHLHALLSVVHYRAVPRDPADFTLTSISPESAVIGDPDVTLVCTGTGFTPDSLIVFNGGEEATTVISDTEVSTIVKPSTAGTPGSYPVSVRNGDGMETEQLMFTFEAAEEPLPELDTLSDEDAPIPVTDIAGIGPTTATKLADVGITDARQIAAWSEDEALDFDTRLGLGGKIARDKWVEQARTLTA